MKIMIIDDSKVVHNYVESLLKDSEHTLLHAYDGSEGIEKVAASSAEGLDLIFLDWEMPKMTGIEVLERIGKAQGTPPIIMMTTKNDPDDIVRALTLGAKEYLMKPFTKDLLFEKINMVLSASTG